MKKLILIVAILAATTSFGAKNPSLSEIVENATLDLSKIELNEYHQDFVIVSFSIKDHQISIIDILGSQEELIQLITSELRDLHIEREYSDTDVFYYKFIFKKV